ncbi:MAG TPA: enoyl-CoA hydratase/isomerase family protein [Phenylobacterium sp.]|uniref:enoyl-CoA hydratase/isomerase family protein n=1 Tax=Phenylobacterium sp. TaxID=1871053 RepID=UPI002C6E7CA6|nr:enoyl-CoA hydratase/isomerase family protein [Phenylobacterium sp.]HSV03387.1 enoyl-CoA hydratase/isomerase family protein [Phenylobacterium sp.]
MSEGPEVIVRIEGRVGRLTLNRPQALHALTTPMCREMIAALAAWRSDPAVEIVMLDHSGERGFCAGGDIRTLAESGAGDGIAAREFFFTEYRLDNLLFHYPKHVVAFMDGVVMGGGVGISRPARFRVGTQRTVFAMPETGIGLFPDVGGSWYLARMPDHIGLWLALTGARIRAADCELLGVITDYVEAARLEALKAAIVERPAALETLLTEFEADPGRPPLAAHQDEIAHFFAGGSVEAIVRALHAADSDWAREQASAIASKSPTSLKVAFRQLQLGARATSFTEVMEMEYRIAHRLTVGHDFLEGVRAVIVDKDGAPKWAPARLEDVSEAAVDGIFASLASGQAWSPLP